MEKGDGGTVGSVVNHVGFIVDDVQKRAAEWKAKGVAVLPGGNGRLDQAFVVTPDGVRIEILEDKTQTVPIRNEHIHLSLTAAEVPEGAGVVREDVRRQGRHAEQPAGRGSAGRADPLRHGGLEAGGDQRAHPRPHRLRREGPRGLRAKLQADGVKLDEPPRTGGGGNTITYITDPWGTRIEIIQRAPLGQQVQSTQ